MKPTSGALSALLTIGTAATVLMLRNPIAWLWDSPALSGAPSPPTAILVKPVAETLWGKDITDNYRYMEALEPSTIEWLKGQGAYTRSILDAIRPRAALEAFVDPRRIRNGTGMRIKVKRLAGSLPVNRIRFEV